MRILYNLQSLNFSPPRTFSHQRHVPDTFFCLCLCLSLYLPLHLKPTGLERAGAYYGRRRSQTLVSNCIHLHFTNLSTIPGARASCTGTGRALSICCYNCRRRCCRRRLRCHRWPTWTRPYPRARSRPGQRRPKRRPLLRRRRRAATSIRASRPGARTPGGMHIIYHSSRGCCRRCCCCLAVFTLERCFILYAPSKLLLSRAPTAAVS